MSARLSSADAAWLHMDRPTNLMVINSVLLFDEPIDVARIKQVCRRRLIGRYPRFRQRVIESRLPLRPPTWEDDPDFDLEHHVHHLALPAPGDTRALRELVSELIATPLDHNRPLWQVYLVDGFGDGAAMITRMHHCIADGIALAQVMLSLTDSAPDAEPDPAADRPQAAPAGGLTGLARPALRLAASAAHIAIGAGRQGAALISSPSHGASLAGAISRDAATSVRLLLTPADAATAIKGDPGVSRRVAWTSPLSLREIKDVAHAHDATVNDVLLAAVSGALRHYLQDHDSSVAEIQAMVPFNLRDLDRPVPRELGNKFGLVFMPLPVGTSGSYRRLINVHHRMQEIKNGRDGAVSYGMLSLTGLTPEPVERRIIDMFSAKGTAVITNVPGPREPIYLAGTPIRTVLFWAPTSGHIGLSISIFSYRGEVTVGLMVDAALIPEPDQIVTALEQELETLRHLKPARATHANPAPPRVRRGQLMKRFPIAIAAVLAALWLAAVALAAFRQSAAVTLTTHTAGRSTGVTAVLHSSDPTAPGTKPKSTTRVTITFPRGTTFNLRTSLVSICRLTDKELTTPFGPACPAKSRIGSGTAQANASPLQQVVNAGVTAYVQSADRILLDLAPTLPGATPIIIHATVSGSTLTMAVPRVVLGKAHGFAGITAVLVSLKLRIPALGRGRDALILAGRCTAHQFVVISRFIYADRSRLTVRRASPCL